MPGRLNPDFLSTMKTAYILEDEHLLRDLVKNFAVGMAGLEIVGSSGDGALAIREILDKKPDVVFADIKVPEVSGLEVLYVIRRRLPETKVIVFTGSISADNIKIAYEGGVDAFVEKGGGLEEFGRAIEAVRSGKRYFSEHIMKILREVKGGSIQFD